MRSARERRQPCACILGHDQHQRTAAFLPRAWLEPETPTKPSRPPRPLGHLMALTPLNGQRPQSPRKLRSGIEDPLVN